MSRPSPCAPPTALTVAVVDIEEHPTRFPLRANADWWDANRALLPDHTAELRTPIELGLEGYRLGQRLLFRGDVVGRLELRCGRCVEPFERPLNERLELLLEPLPTAWLADRSDGDALEGGLLLDAEDLEMGQYAGEQLDFGAALREILIFNWPMQPRCEEGCLGLCPSCGVNRNRETCQCPQSQHSQSRNQELQSPFAELGKLLDQSGIKTK